MAGKKKPNLWYLVILGVAGVGLALDTFVLRANAGTQAATDQAADTESSAASENAKVAALPRDPLGERFDLAASQLSLPAFRRLDAFAKPGSDDIQSTSTESAPGGGFGSRHRLTAVLSQPSGDLAVVDGLLLRIGDTLEGLKLSKIENDGAVFEGEDQTIRLPLARPGLDR